MLTNVMNNVPSLVLNEDFMSFYFLQNLKTMLFFGIPFIILIILNIITIRNKLRCYSVRNPC